MLFWKEKQAFGVLKGKRIYQDTKEKPGIILHSRVIPLSGKPDYIIRDKGTMIPVEVKTGKTPQYPYKNHVMQLIAYCYLVEEYYSIKVPGGYVRYPSKEFWVEYTEEAKQSVVDIVQEIMDCRANGQEFMCKHVEHNMR